MITACEKMRFSRWSHQEQLRLTWGSRACEPRDPAPHERPPVAALVHPGPLVPQQRRVARADLGHVGRDEARQDESRTGSEARHDRAREVEQDGAMERRMLATAKSNGPLVSASVRTWRIRSETRLARALRSPCAAASEAISTASTTAPSRAAPMARIPEPLPKSSIRQGPARGASAASAWRQSWVVSCVPSPNPGPGSMTSWSASPSYARGRETIVQRGAISRTARSGRGTSRAYHGGATGGLSPFAARSP